ncbi:hypothetical protein Pa4123_50840 [Phytohabitans aurantiacus]|uniref:Rhodanese domain-containing protein n=1 Tax=Phytohabitans aurantiacus TaxID=3016789 RepID=A0ABQ5R0U6_9ACTN|nr:hypothetical protein [Phytohabitans aurantiacus]GLH99807.1 hypothetical protein Pa4123_50840 [Phytohabitans aurantiacus]
MAAERVAGVQPPAGGQSGFAFVGERAAALQGFAFEGGIEGFAAALSALEPIALIDWRTPAAWQAAANAAEAYWAVIGVKPISV